MEGGKWLMINGIEKRNIFFLDGSLKIILERRCLRINFEILFKICLIVYFFLYEKSRNREIHVFKKKKEKKFM